MVSKALVTAFIVFGFFSRAQDLVKYNPIKADPAGGAEQMDQVVQTQFEFPKTLLNKDYHETVTMYFLVDSVGNPHHFSFDKTNYDRKLTAELKRIASLLKYNRVFPDPLLPYYVSFSVSSDKYRHYFKQKNKFKITSNLLADSSRLVYSRADRSPVYFKNGEEGLNEFLLEDLEYPSVAREKSIEGTVIVEFIVETNGFITSVIPKQKISAGCSEEAVRLLKKTRWQPAELNNKLVRYKMTYPITFSLRNQARETAGSIGQ